MISIFKLSSQYYKLALAYAGHIDKFEFNKIRSFYERSKYLKENGYILIGKGCGRYTYMESPKKVIKISRSSNGIAQTQVEYTVLSSNQKSFLPKLYDCAPDYSWIELEYCRPVKIDEFLQLSGLPSMSFEEFSKGMYNISDGKTIDYTIRKLKDQVKDLEYRMSVRFESYYQMDMMKLNKQIDMMNIFRKNPLIKSLASFCAKNKLVVGDFCDLDNWGVGSDGTLKIIDVGYSIGVDKMSIEMAEKGGAGVNLATYEEKPNYGLSKIKEVDSQDPHNIIRGQ